MFNGLFGGELNREQVLRSGPRAASVRSILPLAVPLDPPVREPINELATHYPALVLTERRSSSRNCRFDSFRNFEQLAPVTVRQENNGSSVAQIEYQKRLKTPGPAVMNMSDHLAI